MSRGPFVNKFGNNYNLESRLVLALGYIMLNADFKPPKCNVQEPLDNIPAKPNHSLIVLSLKTKLILTSSHNTSHIHNTVSQ